MLPKKHYLIKFGKSNTIIKSGDKIINFKLTDRADYETIVAGKIGDFEHFESQMKSKLDQIGFKKKTLKRQIAYVAIPTNASPSDKKVILDSINQIGFQEIYLIQEHHALAYKLIQDLSPPKSIGVIDLEDGRIELSLIEGKTLTKNTAMDLGQERMKRYMLNPKTLLVFEELILEEIEHFFGASITQLKIVITGNRRSAFNITNKLLQEKRITLEELNNRDELIINGLESISKFEK